MKFSVKITRIMYVYASRAVSNVDDILEKLGNNSSVNTIHFILNDIKLAEYEYADSLNDIALFIDMLVNNRSLLNLQRLFISIDGYNDLLVNVLGQISRLIKNNENLNILSYTTELFHKDDFEFKKQELSKLTNKFLRSQTTVEELHIHTIVVPNARCLRLFKHLDIKFLSPDIEELGYFVRDYIDILNYQNIESLKLAGLPDEYLIRIIEALNNADSLKIFGISGYFDDRIIGGVANLLSNNNSIERLYVTIKDEYYGILEALRNNGTLRVLHFDNIPFNVQRRIEFFNDIDKMLDQNFELIEIYYPIDEFFQRSDVLKALSRNIRGKLDRNREIFNNIGFARTKAIFH